MRSTGLRTGTWFFVQLIFLTSLVAVGGGEDLRRYWSDYLKRTHILVYVVDSSDRSRLPLAKAELHRLLRAEPHLPVVVLGNKQVETSQNIESPIKRKSLTVATNTLTCEHFHAEFKAILQPVYTRQRLRSRQLRFEKTFQHSGGCVEEAISGIWRKLFEFDFIGFF